MLTAEEINNLNRFVFLLNYLLTQFIEIKQINGKYAIYYKNYC